MEILPLLFSLFVFWPLLFCGWLGVIGAGLRRRRAGRRAMPWMAAGVIWLAVAFGALAMWLTGSWEHFLSRTVNVSGPPEFSLVAKKTFDPLTFSWRRQMVFVNRTGQRLYNWKYVIDDEWTKERGTPSGDPQSDWLFWNFDVSNAYFSKDGERRELADFPKTVSLVCTPNEIDPGGTCERCRARAASAEWIKFTWSFD